MQDDGFDICALDGLDKSPDDGLLSPTKLIDIDEDASKSFIVTSLVCTRIVLTDDVTEKLDAAKEGSTTNLLRSWKINNEMIQASLF